MVVSNQASKALTSPGFAASIGSSRILAANEAGLPESLRYTDTNNFAPRVGVAWRPFSSNNTVLRMGYGIYTTRILGAVFNSLTGIHTSDNATYRNTFDAAAVAELAAFNGQRIEVPACFIAGRSDWGTYQTPGALEAMTSACASYAGPYFIEEAGHCVAQEQPRRLDATLGEFLTREAH